MKAFSHVPASFIALQAIDAVGCSSLQALKLEINHIRDEKLSRRQYLMVIRSFFNLDIHL